MFALTELWTAAAPTKRIPILVLIHRSAHLPCPHAKLQLSFHYQFAICNSSDLVPPGPSPHHSLPASYAHQMQTADLSVRVVHLARIHPQLRLHGRTKCSGDSTRSIAAKPLIVCRPNRLPTRRLPPANSTLIAFRPLIAPRVPCDLRRATNSPAQSPSSIQQAALAKSSISVATVLSHAVIRLLNEWINPIDGPSRRQTRDERHAPSTSRTRQQHRCPNYCAYFWRKAPLPLISNACLRLPRADHYTPAQKPSTSRTGSAAASSCPPIRSTSSAHPSAPQIAPALGSRGIATSRTRKFWLSGFLFDPRTAANSPKKFGPPDATSAPAKKYAGNRRRGTLPRRRRPMLDES